MAIKSGFAAKVTLGTYPLAGASQWSMDGVTRQTLDSSAFQDETNTYEFGVRDGGTITISGFYSTGDTNGQIALDTACKNATKLSAGGLRLYIDSVSYWTVGSGGSMLVSKAQAVDMARNDLGKYNATIKVSGAPMELI